MLASLKVRPTRGNNQAMQDGPEEACKRQKVRPFKMVLRNPLEGMPLGLTRQQPGAGLTEATERRFEKAWLLRRRV